MRDIGRELKSAQELKNLGFARKLKYLWAKIILIASLTLELPSASIDVFSFFKLCFLKPTQYFLLKLFDFYFFVGAHNLLKFQKVFVIRHRNKLTPTYNYQARQLTLQAI